ncbi:MAG: SsrA-binding protein [Deltaproteobacteria bacterium RBG_16_71_12]|nr:MAG: SsrA-binding protein [Deltaproteobacteria bacterium RBG_16_71_12]
MAERKPRPEDATIADNRRSRHDYEILDTVECGLELKGAEVKSLRARNVAFGDAYALVKGGELWLLGLKIDRFKNASTHEELAPDRTRRLLAKPAEIERLYKAVALKGHTLVPLKLYFKGPWAKVLIGVGRGKSHEDKRETVKRREADREMERALRRGR